MGRPLRIPGKEDHISNETLIEHNFQVGNGLGIVG